MADEMPDINSPEIRSHIYEMMMGLMEAANASIAIVDAAQKMTFDELTPAKWAQFVQGLDVIRPVHEFVIVSVQNSGVLMDDPEMMEKVKAYAIEEMRQEKEG